MRYALVTKVSKETAKSYLPSNYHALIERDIPGVGTVVLIGGQDSAGWTLDDYVLPRLASGLYFGREVSSVGAANFQHCTHLDACV